MQLDIGHDYPMSADILYFEAYMFATTKKQMAKQVSFRDFHIYESDGLDRIHRMSVEDEDERKDLLDSFNAMLKRHGKSALSDGTLMPAFIIYIEPESEDGDHPYDDIWSLFVAALDAWTESSGRCAVMTAHYDQTKDGYRMMAHVHIMYEKEPGTKDELEKFIMQKLFGHVQKD